LNSQGQLFGFGLNSDGQLGSGHDGSIPFHIEIDRIISMGSGDSHSLLLNNQGQVFSLGYNGDGQLGLGDNLSRDAPTLIDTSQIGEIDSLGSARVVAISAGIFHSLLLNYQGQVFSFGYGSFGLLGLGDNKERTIPTLIDTSKIGEIVAISVGDVHSLLLNCQGQVFGFGKNDRGQLGLEIKSRHDDHRNFPTLIENYEIGKILAISAGGEHSLILNSRGQVFSFGKNDRGQLGLGDQIDRSIPTLIDLPDIVAISAGGEHSLFLNSQGQVFGCGNGRWGRLGLGNNDDKLIPTLIEGFVI
jgi:alpha-tubulin suppressor-like RCC1 family protein